MKYFHFFIYRNVLHFICPTRESKYFILHGGIGYFWGGAACRNSNPLATGAVYSKVLEDNEEMCFLSSIFIQGIPYRGVGVWSAPLRVYSEHFTLWWELFSAQSRLLCAPRWFSGAVWEVLALLVQQNTGTQAGMLCLAGKTHLPESPILGSVILTKVGFDLLWTKTASVTKTWFRWGQKSSSFRWVSLFTLFRAWGFAAVPGAWQKTRGILRLCGRSCLKSSKANQQLAFVTWWALSQGFSQLEPLLVLENKPHFHHLWHLCECLNLHLSA